MRQLSAGDGELVSMSLLQTQHSAGCSRCTMVKPQGWKTVDKAGYEQAKNIFTLARKSLKTQEKCPDRNPGSAEDTKTLRHHSCTWDRWQGWTVRWTCKHTEHLVKWQGRKISPEGGEGEAWRQNGLRSWPKVVQGRVEWGIWGWICAGTISWEARIVQRLGCVAARGRRWGQGGQEGLCTADRRGAPWANRKGRRNWWEGACQGMIRC